MPVMKEVRGVTKAKRLALTDLGIDVVRNRIKGFAQKKVTLPQGRHKLVILDEADRYDIHSNRTRSIGAMLIDVV